MAKSKESKDRTAIRQDIKRYVAWIDKEEALHRNRMDYLVGQLAEAYARCSHRNTATQEELYGEAPMTHCLDCGMIFEAGKPVGAEEMYKRLR